MFDGEIWHGNRRTIHSLNQQKFSRRRARTSDKARVEIFSRFLTMQQRG